MSARLGEPFGQPFGQPLGQPFYVVIPARYASSRLPGKPLADIGGVPMVVHVARRAAECGAAEVVVATDDERVLEAVQAAGFAARMTKSDHVSGSDRVMEVAAASGWAPDAVVINVQGDEPLVPPKVIAQVAALLTGDPDVGVATLSEPITDPALVFDPNVVKVVVGNDGFARWFSRAPIPYARDGFARDDIARAGVAVPERAAAAIAEQQAWFRHVGLYGYRLAALRRFVELPPGKLERVESLEQLRLIENGIGIRVAPAVQAVPGGVDTEADLQRIRGLIGHGN